MQRFPRRRFLKMGSYCDLLYAALDPSRPDRIEKYKLGKRTFLSILVKIQSVVTKKSKMKSLHRKGAIWQL